MGKRRPGQLLQFPVAVRESGSQTAESVGRPDQDGIAEFPRGFQCVRDVGNDEGGRHLFADLGNSLGKKFPVLGVDDRADWCAWWKKNRLFRSLSANNQFDRSLDSHLIVFGSVF